MGIAIKDALKLKNLTAFRQIAGSGGLDRAIEAVGILEHEINSGMDDSFYEGDFVLTSFYPIKDNPERIMEVIRVLQEIGVAGIAIKEVYLKDIPQDVSEFADERNFPIFFFGDDVYIEDIVYEIVKALKDDENDAYLASKVHGLLGAPLGRESVKRIALEINASFKDWAYVVCLAGDADMRERVSVLNMGPYRNPNETALAFGDFIILIHTMEMKEIDEVALLERIRQNGSWKSIGTSGELCGLDELDKGIEKAIYALNVSKAYGKQRVSYRGMGLYRLLAPFAGSYWANSFYEKTIGELRRHDELYEGNLLETAETFVACGGDFSKAAGLLFVHPNTVRYRIEKIKEIFNTDESIAGFHEELAVAVRLHKIKPGM